MNAIIITLMVTFFFFTLIGHFHIILVSLRHIGLCIVNIVRIVTNCSLRQLVNDKQSNIHIEN